MSKLYNTFGKRQSLMTVVKPVVYFPQQKSQVQKKKFVDVKSQAKFSSSLITDTRSFTPITNALKHTRYTDQLPQKQEFVIFPKVKTEMPTFTRVCTAAKNLGFALATLSKTLKWRLQ